MPPTKHMKSYRILNIEPSGYCDEARSLLADLGSLTEKEMSRDELISRLNQYEVLIVRLSHQIDQDIINDFRRRNTMLNHNGDPVIID